jgi:hypothetical protein
VFRGIWIGRDDLRLDRRVSEIAEFAPLLYTLTKPILNTFHIMAGDLVEDTTVT